MRGETRTGLQTLAGDAPVKWRWLLFDYVDPQLSLTREERRRVRRRAWKAQRRVVPPAIPGRSSLLTRLAGGRAVGWVDLVSALIPAAVMLLVLLPTFLAARLPPWSIFPTLFVQVTVSWILMALLGRLSWKPRVNAALRELGYDVCRRCGYWLRGLSETVERCPECGHERRSDER